MTLKEHIAKALMKSPTGLTRNELGKTIDVSIYENNLDRISDNLFRLKKAEHATSSKITGRWSITQRGRAAYSDLHDDDETDNQTQPAKADTIPPVSMDHRAESDTTASQEIQETDTSIAMVLDIVQEPIPETMHLQPEATQINQHVSDDEMARAAVMATALDDYDQSYVSVLKFDTAQTIDKALFGLVNLIRDVANQQPAEITIENKAEALTLLETMECNQLFSGAHRATFSRIRQAVELLEDAA